MSPEYELTVGEKTHIVEVERLDEGGLLIVKTNGKSYTIKAEQNEDGSWTANDTVTDYHIKIAERAGSKFVVEIDDEPHEVMWTRSKKQAATSTSSPSAASSGPKVPGGVYPPMPGKITEVHVDIGDTVKSGQTVCILEAMKMFNELKAPQAGTVKEVHVEPGSSVTQGQLVILIE